MSLEVELSLGTHSVRFENVGYDILLAEIDVAETGVSCLSVTDGLCGSLVPPGVIASNFLVTGYLKEAPAPVCSWITGLGGWEAIMASHIMDIVSAYLGVTGLGFAVTVSHIMGAVAYYLNEPESGDGLTGCTTP